MTCSWNALGFRGPSCLGLEPKKPGERRILLTGGSFAASWYTNDACMTLPTRQIRSAGTPSRRRLSSASAEGVKHRSANRSVTSRLISSGMGRLIVSELEENFAGRIFSTHIPRSTIFEQAEYSKHTIFESHAASYGAKAYRELATELCGILGNPE